MGRHFDSLVDMVKNHVTRDETIAKGSIRVKDYLEKIIVKTKLFDGLCLSPTIFPNSGKDFEEYCKYIWDYYDMSKQHGKALILPFPVTAIEDDDSVVILLQMEDKKHAVVSCGKNLMKETETEDDVSLYLAEVDIHKPLDNLKFPAPVVLRYCIHTHNNKKIYTEDIPGASLLVAQDIVNHMAAYAQQIVYIMDPENFIIKKENNASIKQREKQRRSGRRMLLKSNMRPHYIVLSLEDTRELFVGQSKDAFPAHPVVGHWRTLMSERYIHMRGQRIQIPQYFTGDGKVAGKGGWNFEVLIKIDPLTIVPYSRYRDNR